MSRAIAVLLPLLLLCGPAMGELRDPMQPFGYQPGGGMTGPATESLLLQPELFRLSAIFCGPRGRRAVINDRHLEEGDEIEGARLVTIDTHAVELEMQGKTIKIELLPLTVKTPSKGLPGGGR